MYRRRLQRAERSIPRMGGHPCISVSVGGTASKMGLGTHSSDCCGATGLVATTLACVDTTAAAAVVSAPSCGEDDDGPRFDLAFFLLAGQPPTGQQGSRASTGTGRQQRKGLGGRGKRGRAMMPGMPRRRSCRATPAPTVRCNAAAPHPRTTRTATHGRASVVSGRGCANPAPRRWIAAAVPGSGTGGSGRRHRRGCASAAAAGRASCSVPRRRASPAPTARGLGVAGCGSAAGPARSAAVMTIAIASAASSPCRFLQPSEHERSEGLRWRTQSDQRGVVGWDGRVRGAGDLACSMRRLSSSMRMRSFSDDVARGVDRERGVLLPPPPAKE